MPISLTITKGLTSKSTLRQVFEKDRAEVIPWDQALYLSGTCIYSKSSWNFTEELNDKTPQQLFSTSHMSMSLTWYMIWSCASTGPPFQDSTPGSRFQFASLPIDTINLYF